jgi:AraC-like DNA-binding protein
MSASSRGVMKRQAYRPKDAGAHNTDVIASMGVASPETTAFRRGRDWVRHQVCRHSGFSLVALESYQAASESIGYTRQEGYIKINFWLGGKHTTVLDGYGQYDHDRPEIFITSVPRDMLKVDVLNRDTHTACVALCLLPEFFPVHMAISAEELPEPLRGITVPEDKPYAFHRYPLTADLAAATRAILAAPFAVRRQPVYAQAKAIELMCLLLNRMEQRTGKSGVAERPGPRHQSRLYEARDLLTRRYAEAITLPAICREVGLNRMALTSGFRELFGMSVHEFLHKVRMERAYELLLQDASSITRVAEDVGYLHSCNFSTAFRAYFGCSPRQVGRDRP